MIYAYIKQFRNIFGQEVCFSDRFSVSYDPSKTFPSALTIRPRVPDKTRDTIYEDSKLSSVHLIVGKTGAGKTNILQMIGMTEEERLNLTEPGDSYFLLWEDSGIFIIEPFDILLDSAIIPQIQRTEAEDRLPQQIVEQLRLQDTMCIYHFTVDENGKPTGVKLTGPGSFDTAYIFTGMDKHAFSHYPYEDVRKEGTEKRTIWMPRVIAEYHRTALWYSCRWLREYIDEFSEDSLKRKAALVIENHNWRDRIKQHIPDDLEESDYWTFEGRTMMDDLDRFQGKKVREHREVSIKRQFIYDLWTDFALYLRKWIGYIHQYPEGMSEENLDALDTAGVYQEFLDCCFEKEQDETEETGKRDIIDPTVLPDYEKIGILKRIEWLSMYIDRKRGGAAKGLLWQIYSDIRDIGEILMRLDDKYFTTTAFTMPIVDMYSDENKILIEDLFERMEQYRPDDIGIFTERLLPYHFDYISSGEYQFAAVLGGIEEYCVKLSLASEEAAPTEHDEKLGYDPQKVKMNKLDNKPNVLYLLDEPETYMHPELCRTFLSRLDAVLKNRVADTDVQIIITTHSPMLLSDVLPSQITRLDLDERGYCRVKNGSEKAYFGANIHTILSDGFFLNYTIGEYARVYLQQRMEWLNGLSAPLNLKDRTELERIQLIVPLIGDTVIRGSFEQKLRQLDD